MKHCPECGNKVTPDLTHCAHCDHLLKGSPRKAWKMWCFGSFVSALIWMGINLGINQDYFASAGITKNIWLGQAIFLSVLLGIFIFILYWLVRAINYRGVSFAEKVIVLVVIGVIVLVLNEAWFLSVYTNTYEKITGEKSSSFESVSLQEEMISEPLDDIQYTHRYYTFSLPSNFQQSRLLPVRKEGELTVYIAEGLDTMENFRYEPPEDDVFVFVNKEKYTLIIINAFILGDVPLDRSIMELKELDKLDSTKHILNEQYIDYEGTRFFWQEYVSDDLENFTNINYVGNDKGIVYDITITAPSNKAKAIANELLNSFHITYKGLLQCPDDLTIFKGHCCPRGTQAYRDGQCLMCPTGMVPIEGNFCCPEGFTKVSNKGNCYN